MSWTPRLDDVDRAIIDRLVRVGSSWLTLRDLRDAPETCDLDRDELLARMEILIEAGLVRRADYFALAEQAAGFPSETVPDQGRSFSRNSDAPLAPSPAESAEVAA